MAPAAPDSVLSPPVSRQANPQLRISDGPDSRSQPSRHTIQLGGLLLLFRVLGILISCLLPDGPPALGQIPCRNLRGLGRLSGMPCRYFKLDRPHDRPILPWC